MGFKPFLSACHIFAVCIVVCICNVMATKVLSLSPSLSPSVSRIHRLLFETYWSTHAPPLNHYSEYRTQLLVWCLISVFVITWHQHWSSYTGYLSNTESNTSCVHWCIKSTLDVRRLTWLTLCNQALNPVVDPVRDPPTPLTTSNVALELNFGERCFSHAGPDVCNSLPDSIKHTADTNRFKNVKNSSIHLSLWHLSFFMSAPEHSVSRAL